jgi:hypothetical protein
MLLPYVSIKYIKKHNEMQSGEGGKENAIIIKNFR